MSIVGWIATHAVWISLIAAICTMAACFKLARMTRSVHRAAIGLGAFVLFTPLLRYIWYHEMMWPVAAYHVLDVPADKTGGFTFFYWASWCVPGLWVLSLGLLMIEALRKRRWALLTTYAALPLAGAAAYWTAWQGFLIYLFRALA